MSLPNVSVWAIKNPLSPIILFVVLLLAGALSFATMEISRNPDVAYPAAQITIIHPGAAPTEIEAQIAQKVESAVRNVNGVDFISTRIDEGSFGTLVQFNIGTPIDHAVNDIREAIASIRSDLPDDILEPQVKRFDIDGEPIAYFSVEATDITLEDLSWYVDNTISKQLQEISGVALVQRSGGVTREIRVILDPSRLQAYGVTASQINQQLRAKNVNVAGGRTEIAGSEQSVRVLGNAQTVLLLSRTKIKTMSGANIRLADIAAVRDLYAEQRNVSKINGKQVVSLSITKSKGSSDVLVYDAAWKLLKKLEEDNPKIRFRLLFTTVDYTRDQYRSAIAAMVEGAALAIVVVLIFLRDWRATLITSLAIPLSAIPTFFFMDMLGFTLNGISLLALSLVMGVLVDDAIVEIENITRHMRMGKTAYQASIDATDEIGLAVLATTMAIVAVFLPVGLMPGFTGQFFKQFGLTVVLAVLVSLLVARLITPMIAAYFLKPESSFSESDGAMMDRYKAMLDWLFNSDNVRACKAHGGLSSRFAFAWDRRIWMLGVSSITIILTIVLLIVLPKTFQPTRDSDYSRIHIKLVPGSTLAQTENVVDQVSALLNSVSEIDTALSEISPGNAEVYLTLNKSRQITSVEFERAMAKKLRRIPDAQITFQSQNSGLGRDVTIMLAGGDPDLVTRTAQQLVEEMKALKELRAPRIEGDLPRPELIIRPRFDLADDLGVSTTALSQTIRIATQGDIDQNVAKFSLSGRQIRIGVMLDPTSRKDLSSIEQLPVETTRGGTVPLKMVAQISFESGPSVLRRHNQFRRVAISADLAPGIVTAKAAIESLPTIKRMPEGVKRIEVGDDKLQTELVTNFLIAVVSGILLVFAVLVLLYRRLLPPIVNMSSLLLAPLGGLIALSITGNAISLPVYIGLLMLFGIVAKNSILLVDFALKELTKGVDRTAAIIDSGHKRAKPIVMTTVAMVAGMVPITLTLTGDGGWRAPMGIVVIGGLLLSTLLTLLIVPAMLSLALGLESRAESLIRRRHANNGDTATSSV